MRSAFGKFISGCGIVGGAAMMIRGWNLGDAGGNQFYQGLSVLLMGLIVYAVFARARS